MGRSTTGPPRAAPWWVTLHMCRCTDATPTDDDRYHRPLL